MYLFVEHVEQSMHCRKYLANDNKCHHFLNLFLAFDFCWFCVIIRFFHPNDLRLRRISIPDLIHYIFCPIVVLQKELVFPFSMYSAKQGHYWYHFYNVFGMTRSLTGD